MYCVLCKGSFYTFLRLHVKVIFLPHNQLWIYLLVAKDCDCLSLVVLKYVLLPVLLLLWVVNGSRVSEHLFSFSLKWWSGHCKFYFLVFFFPPKPSYIYGALIICFPVKSYLKWPKFSTSHHQSHCQMARQVRMAALQKPMGKGSHEICCVHIRQILKRSCLF